MLLPYYLLLATNGEGELPSFSGCGEKHSNKEQGKGRGT